MERVGRWREEEERGRMKGGRGEMGRMEGRGKGEMMEEKEGEGGEWAGEGRRGGEGGEQRSGGK